MKDFNGLNLPAALMQNLERMQYKTPTPIQAQTIPLALEGRDVLGSAQTGTGKTASFSIPVIAKLMSSPRGSALIMLPTRELAVQVVTVIKQMLGSASTIKTACLIGGEPMHPQFKQLQARPRIIVGTPGRINDHLERGSLKLHDAGLLVLDETDRMLDMGFGIQIDKILKFAPKQRQTLMFSATMPKNIMAMSAKYLVNPQRIEVGTNNKPIENIKQDIVYTTDADKYSELVKQLNDREGTVIVFVKTKRGAEKLTKKLNNEGHSTDTIHGDLPQKKRDRVIKAFREKEHRIMVATDIAARGLDIPHIKHVVNYDLPMQPEDYVHRIGRTARNGELGSALCLVTPEDRSKMNAINRLIDPNFKPERREGGAGRGRGGKSDSPYAKKRSFGNKGGKGGFGGGKKFGGGGFKPKGDGFGRDRAEGEARSEFRGEGRGEFRPERKEGGFKPRGERKEGSFKPRGERNDGEFKPRGEFRGERSEGGFKPRGERKEGGFKPKGEGFKRDRSNDGEFKPRGEFRSDKKEGGFKPKGEGFRKSPNGFGGAKKFSRKPSGGRKFSRHEDAA